ncbi:hypothetical protein HYW83_03615 [Candidatus Peregrinibacteria bacterium]|nr:hypothetical protein [Candidatus Peregrinibacteria bacterium]
MFFKFLKNILHPSDTGRFLNSNRFVFQRRPGRGPYDPTAVGTYEDEEDEQEQRQQEEQEQKRQQQRRQALESETTRAPVSPETKQRMREYLASGSVEKENLVERLLKREIEEREFNRDFETVEREDASWSTIFSTQRAVRKKIQALQWRTESYIEIIPRERSNFEALLKNVRGLNRLDDSTDRGLKRILRDLTLPNEQRSLPAVLNAEEAREIYEVNPLQDSFERTLKKYQSKIESAPNAGSSVLRRIAALKKEEAQIERKFSRMYDEVNGLISRHLQKVRSKAEREALLKTASRAVGITIQEGTEIEFQDPGILALFSPKSTVKIARVSWDPIVVRDRSGKVVSQINGAPHIHLSNGAEMTLGRFKKWADAADAVEKINNVSDIEAATGLAQYGIKIEPGMELFYPKRTRDRQSGEINTMPVYVRITDIRDGKIHFDEAVLFQPGMEGTDEYDMRSVLTFGEFVKWWHRYDVEKSVSLHELEKFLFTYNEIENKTFGLDAKENPPILVKQGEMLHYPDESGSLYRIENVDTDGVSLDNGKKYSLPEFFSWVKHNHVRKAPEREKTPQEKAAEIERESEIQHKSVKEEADEEAEVHEWEHRREQIIKYRDDRASGTLVEKMRGLWWSTNFLSLKDLWNMTKEIVEFVKRKHERRSKGRYGDAGSRLPWVVGTEFERVKQAAENEEVNKYKEAMEHWSIEKVKRTLYETGSKDEAKACIMTLIAKGEMRWDDHHFWHTLNRLTSRYTLRGAELRIPPPHLIPPGKSGEDMTQPAMDALWGDGTGSEWFQENINKYNSNKNNFEYKFKNLEADPKGTGGPSGECQRLLKIWLEGEYVNPQDYEEMIDGAIKYGKMSAEDKMFFIIAGCVARQGNRPDGETLLPLDRPGELDSKYLNQFPLLDFFTQTYIKDPAYPKPRKLLLKDYEKWTDEYFHDELYVHHKRGPGFSRFMWEVMLTSEQVRTRISKGIRNAENMDHDDAHLYIPPTTPSEIDGLTTGPTGQKKYFTNEGYANAYPGFNQYLVSLSYSIEEETNEEEKQNKTIALRDTINGFIRYDAILDNRFLKKEGDHRARLDDRHFRRRTVVDDSMLQLHRDQLRNLILEIGRAYGQDWDSWLYGPKTGSYFDANEKKKQDEYERKLDGLKDLIPRLVEQDGGAKILEVVKRARAVGDIDPANARALRGIQSSKRPSSSELKTLEEKAAHARAERARLQAEAHGGH